MRLFKPFRSRLQSSLTNWHSPKLLIRCAGIAWRSLVVICALVLVTMSQAAAYTQNDVDCTYDSTCWYNSADCPAGEQASATVPPGNLPTIIPEPYNGAFTQGGSKNNVAPALVAAIFTEENLTQTPTAQLATAWQTFTKDTQPDPNNGWPYSHVPASEVWPGGEAPNAAREAAGETLPANGAGGPFQFEPDTWSGLGFSTSGNAEENLVNAANAAAKYLASDGATTDKPPSSWQTAILDYNDAQWYVDAVMEYYNFYNSGTSTTTPPAPTTSTTQTCSGTSTTTSVDCNGAVPAGTAGLSQTRQEIVCIAQNQLALWKSKPGYASADFPYAAKGFLPYSQGRYEEWCADFSSWVYNQAGKPLQSPDWNISYVPNIQAIGGTGGFVWHPAGSGYTPVPGDLAIHGSAHVNIYVSYANGQATYIGGDQGNNGPYGTEDPPSESIVSTEVWPGYWGAGDPEPITGYISPPGN